MSHLTYPLLLAWTIFGGSEPAPLPPSPPIDTNALVQAAVEKAVASAAEKVAQVAADLKSAEAAKVDEETKAEAEKLRLEAKAEAEKLRLEAREDAKSARAEAKAEAEKEKVEYKESRRQIDSRVFRLCHASAPEVADRLNAMWSGDFGQDWKLAHVAVSFEESNAVLVTAPKVVLDACAKAVAELDVETPQVYIEARFVELGNTASHKVGIDWRMLDGLSGSLGVEGELQSTTVGSGVQEFTRSIVNKGGTTTYMVGGGSGSDGDVRSFTGTLNFSQMALTLRALDATEDSKTFSNPKIIVSSGKRALVDMTTKYPNVQIAAKKTINNNNESVDLDMKMSEIPGEDKFMFAKEAFFSWGLALEVTPRIGTNGLINVSIVPTISQLDVTQGDGGFVTAGTGSGGSSEGGYSARYPIIEVKRLVTEFNMKSGTTAVIGGLSRTIETQQDSGIPLLRDIPWLGPRLFGSMVRVKEQREIIVFVTVGLVDPQTISPDAGLPKNAVLGRQYTKGQKLEPGDRPARNMEGFDSLDIRSLEEQAHDPLPQDPPRRFRFSDYIPFTKDPNYKNETDTKK